MLNIIPTPSDFSIFTPYIMMLVPISYQKKQLFTLSLFLVLAVGLIAQENTGIRNIIAKIQELEQNKDPKCYATANRLEDFMYGTPLTDEARNFKIDIQKEIIYYLKEQGSKNARKQNQDIIRPDHIAPIISSLSQYEETPQGDFLYHLTTGIVRISKRDYAQYSSVSYGYRSLLSVEQDLLYFSESNVLSFDNDALDIANSYVNLLTLVTLKVADLRARKANKATVSREDLAKSWVLILDESRNATTLASVSYPKPSTGTISEDTNNAVVKEIIKQKLASYAVYNELNTNVFLRNVQVYFARQRWPIDNTTSDALRNYYLESLIAFTSALLEQSDKTASVDKSQLIRAAHVKKASLAFLPEITNSFEDVTFFPNNQEGKVTIESYDLDAFRDSGFHWRILGYSLDDLNTTSIKSLDPNGAEQLVEAIAQLGVLVLRLAGEFSHDANKKVLDKQDITQGFTRIQQLINSYDFNTNVTNTTQISSSGTNNSNKTSAFREVTNEVGISFQHKSSDWLNRLIRGYSVSEEEKVIRLAIPPAFGGSGVACEDINNDGHPDVLLLGGFGNKLYLNNGNGSFTDSSDASGINVWNDALNSYGEPRQPIIADFNNYGTQDLFITYVNDPHRMYKNTGDARFEDISNQTGLGGDNAVAGPATAFDYDNDGLLDIFIGYFGNYVEGVLPTLSRDNQNGMPNKLFKNMGDFVFKEVVFTADLSSNRGWTQALGHSDINQDGLQDIIVGNDFGKNKYYLNQGTGFFKESSDQLGTDKPSYTMNVGITDLNRDLYPDFYISNIVVMQKDEKYVSPNADTEMKFDREKMANIRTVEANDLFLSNVTKNQLKDYQLSTQVGRGYSATGWSWDADFFDFDNDGDEDLYCLNGMNDFSVYSSENPFYFERKQQQGDARTISYAESNREKNVFFVNENGALLNKATALGADLTSNARSASYFDYDNDGDLDILINNYHEKASLLENRSSLENHWIKIKLVGNPAHQINRDAIGSTLVLTSKSFSKVWREIHSTTGYLSVHPKEQHFGLGPDTETNVVVTWSNGEVYTIKDLKANTSYIITYPNTLSER